MYQYFPESDEQWDDETESDTMEGRITQEIDMPFEQFDRTFTPDEELTSNTDAKDFCKFLSMQSRENGEADLSARTPQHIQCLKTVLGRWSVNSRHAAWLLVQSAISRRVSHQTKLEAQNAKLDILADRYVNSYAQYRILHHLTKLRVRRDGQEYRYLYQLSCAHLSRLGDILPNLVSVSDFEVVIAALYTYRVLGKSSVDLRGLVHKCVPASDAEPYKIVLSYISCSSVPVVPVSLATENEPDESIETY